MKDLHDLAAVAGIADFGEMTLRELLWRAERISEGEWARTAWLCHVVAKVAGNKRAKPDDFNPLRIAERGCRRGEMIEWMQDAKEKLPADLTEAEIDTAWNAIKDKVDW